MTFGTFLGAVAGGAHAQVTEIYRCVDAAGKSEYTNDKKSFRDRKCVLVSREVNVVPAQQFSKAVAPKPAAKSSPSDFPKETAEDRAKSAGTKREILEQELSKEQELLGQAKKELAEQESVRNGDEHNYQRVLERLQKYKDNVELHEKNIEALRRELSRLGR